MTRLLLVLLALLFPPAALAAVRTPLGWAAAGLWLVAVAIFFTLAWGPGLLLAGLAGLLAAAALLAAPRRRA
jgi:hypothetical protein